MDREWPTGPTPEVEDEHYQNLVFEELSHARTENARLRCEMHALSVYPEILKRHCRQSRGIVILISIMQALLLVLAFAVVQGAVLALIVPVTQVIYIRWLHQELVQLRVLPERSKTAPLTVAGKLPGGSVSIDRLTA